jgi:hypothetical protein
LGWVDDYDPVGAVQPEVGDTVAVKVTGCPMLAFVGDSRTITPPLGFFLVLRSFTMTLCFLVLTGVFVFIATPEF